MKTPINEDLYGHFEMEERLFIYEDPKAYLNYSYSGAVQLVARKVLISFNSGSCSSYQYGGSGVEGYCWTGGWWMGENLLAVLDEEQASDGQKSQNAC